MTEERFFMEDIDWSLINPEKFEKLITILVYLYNIEYNKFKSN